MSIEAPRVPQENRLIQLRESYSKIATSVTYSSLYHSSISSDSTKGGLLSETSTIAESVNHTSSRLDSISDASYASQNADLESGIGRATRGYSEGRLRRMLRLQVRTWDDGSTLSTAQFSNSSISLPPTSVLSFPFSGIPTPSIFSSTSGTLVGSELSLDLLHCPSTPRSFNYFFGEQYKKGVKDKLGKWTQMKKRKPKRTNMITSAKSLCPQKARKSKAKSLLAKTIDKHQYIILLCRALIRYGAPSNRLEAYMRTTAESLSVTAQFLHMPGSMIISLDGLSTGEVKLVREDEDVDLGRMDSVYSLYKRVAYGDKSVIQGCQDLENLMSQKPQHPKWLLVIIYGLAAAAAGVLGYQVRPIDLPISFILGALVGIMKCYLNPVSELWANCFIILAPFITSVLARIFGSMHEGTLFCFPALAQSGIALILPGYTILCSALELQSGSVVAGSIRLIHALIYSLFLDFGITLGTAVVGAVFPAASTASTCTSPISSYWNLLAAPVFTLCLIMIYRAKLRQVPAQLLVATVGYHARFWMSQWTKDVVVANLAGAFVVGVLANGYSRIGHAYEQQLIRWFWRSVPTTSNYSSKDENITYGLAAAVMIPGIWMYVPSGLAIASDIAAAGQITKTAIGIGDINAMGSIMLEVIQVVVGITAGLFLSTVVVYPFGKKLGGVFSL